MHVDEIRKVVKARPFKAFEIRIENGETYLVPYPDQIFITNQLIVTVDEKGDSILIAPEAVSSIRLIDGKA